MGLIVVEIALVQSRKATEVAERSAKFAFGWTAADHLLAVPTVTDNPFVMVPYPLRHAVSTCTFQDEPMVRPGKDLATLKSGSAKFSQWKSNVAGMLPIFLKSGGAPK